MKKCITVFLFIGIFSGCTSSQAPQTEVAGEKIYHDPDIDFKVRRGFNHNRSYLKKELAAFNLNIDSLQTIVDNLNRETQAREWEYQVSTTPGSQGKIRKVYKSHNNPDGSSGKTIYGDEIRRLPQR